MSLFPLLLRSVCRLLAAIVERPAVVMTTLLHESFLLPRNLNLEHFVAQDLLDGHSCKREKLEDKERVKAKF
ncbi:hypothetical protein SUGI_0491330 [Cryptomeria japonica]|nr:hypothetical protein SUGI_0491330 [Cryptomeria japonica]